MLKYLLILLLVSCGGGSSPTPESVVERVVAPTVSITSSFAYADGNWQTGEDITNKWVIRGTTEDDVFLPANPVWYGPSNGPTQPRTWWKLYTDSVGIHSEVDKVDGLELNFYSGSFINDALAVPQPVSKRPILDVTYKLETFQGDKLRATIGATFLMPNGTYYYLERNIKRTDSFKLCKNLKYDRCVTNITYFPPSDGPMDLRSMLLQSPDLDQNTVDQMILVGVYMGSECYGVSHLHLVVTGYTITING